MTGNTNFNYAIEIVWTGNRGVGTASYSGYDRDYQITAAGKPAIAGSSEPAFRGDSDRYNPEELLVASLSGCHMLWYLHVCANAGVCVTGYTDRAEGRMTVRDDGAGQFTEVILRPEITVTPSSDLDLAHRLHSQAHDKCFVANSVNFPVNCAPEIKIVAETSS